jgi:leader peptidase (prepilin peptidase)/N-methyltransferase
VYLTTSDLPPWLVALIAFGFGAIWGSFFNVAIYRWPLGMSVVKPPSHCPYCRARIPIQLNVPIFGYLLLRGKTACCAQPLSPRYPMVETLSAVLCVAVAQRFVVGAAPDTPLLGAAAIALCYFAFCGGLLIATFADLEHMEIPDEVSLPGAALGLLTAVYRDPPGVEAAAIGAGGGFLLIQVFFVWIYEAVFGRRGMGEGDSKLLMMIGAFLGWQGALFALFAGAAQGLTVAIIAIVRGKLKPPEQPQAGAAQQANAKAAVPPDPIEQDAPRPDDDAGDEGDELDDEPPPRWIGHMKLPFGPFLALGALEHLFFGDVITAAWLDFMGGVQLPWLQ